MKDDLKTLALAALAGFIIITGVLVIVSVASAAEFSASDDAHLVASYRAGTLESMRDNGVRTVRLTAWEDRDYTTSLASAQAATDLGLNVQVVLGPYAGDTPSRDFAGWAADTAARFARAGATRVSVLNEPDLWLPASDLCDTPFEVQRTLMQAGYRQETRSVKTRVKRTRVIRVRVRGRVVRRRVTVTRLVTRVRRAHGRTIRRRFRVPVYRTKWVRRTTVATTVSPTIHTDITPRRGCFAVQRARIAHRTWRTVLPRVRRAALGVDLLVGETSPLDGSAAFIREVARLGMPEAAGWAHHPYPGDFETGLDNAQVVNQLVDLPVYWTEFGVAVRTARSVWSRSLEDARSIWAAARAKADRLGVRQVSSYGWWATGADWDTAAEDVLWRGQ